MTLGTHVKPHFLLPYLSLFPNNNREGNAACSSHKARLVSPAPGDLRTAVITRF
jgi:hypothetical protein